MIRVELDQVKCVAAGQCVMSAPDVFDQREEDGVAVLLTEEIDDSQLEGARDAEALCPAAAIRLLSKPQT